MPTALITVHIFIGNNTDSFNELFNFLTNNPLNRRDKKAPAKAEA
uniref:Uncharacterized protein n=1 Tax=Yersinia ruckeri TaxID=29486 RepID=A0A0A8VK19_YERRU|nr:hypothetical protein CSF007_11075 [Yersinia ruckeri]